MSASQCPFCVAYCPLPVVCSVVPFPLPSGPYPSLSLLPEHPIARTLGPIPGFYPFYFVFCPPFTLLPDHQPRRHACMTLYLGCPPTFSTPSGASLPPFTSKARNIPAAAHPSHLSRATGSSIMGLDVPADCQGLPLAQGSLRRPLIMRPSLAELRTSSLQAGMDRLFSPSLSHPREIGHGGTNVKPILYLTQGRHTAGV